MANPTKCTSCWKPTFQVRILGNDLDGITFQQVYESASNINVAGLKHVAKRTQQDSAFLHFESHLTASVFYNSRIGSSFVVNGISITVQPTILATGETVQYSQRALPFTSSDLPCEPPGELQPSVEPEPQTPSEQVPQPENESQTPSEQVPQPENESQPLADSWKANVKRAIEHLRNTEKRHEKELATVKKRIRLLEETLN